MSFFAVLFALIAEQARPLHATGWWSQAVAAWVAAARRNLDAGGRHHAWLVWAVAVLLPALLAALVHAGLARVSLLLAFAFDVLVLYLTMGFRQFSHHFNAVREALERGDEATARSLLAAWRHVDLGEAAKPTLLRLVIEQSLLAAHRHVFGVFFAFVVFSALGLGPMGAVLYRLAAYLRRGAPQHDPWAAAAVDPRGAAAAGDDAGLLALAQRLFEWIDLLPSRLTAFGFAVVGNFEDAIEAWRRDAGEGQPSNRAVVLAAAGGALGLQLGPSALVAAAASGGGAAAPQVGHLRSVVGLVWRSMVLWLLLLALLTLANLVG